MSLNERFDEEFPITHYWCDDSWFSCPKTEEGSCNDAKGDECDCNAEEKHSKLLAFIRQQIIKHLEDVVPGEEKALYDVGEGKWDDCRQEVLNKIEEIKKDL